MPSKGLYLIADGMGGHRGGEIASQMAVDLICEEIALPDPHSLPPLSLRRAQLERAILRASLQIFETARQNPNLHGMGTTTTATLITGQTAHIGQVGDSRCYLFRQNTLWQLTRDHSWVQERLRAGIITPEQADHEMQTARNVITRSVGFDAKVEVDLYELPLQPNDVLLLCSDGLSSMISHGQIQKTLREWSFSQDSLPSLCTTLIEQANAAGGDDNISVLTVRALASS